MEKDVDVAVVGCVGIDTLIYMKKSDYENDREGAESTVLDTIAHAGGYAARGYVALGYKTAFIGFVGNDVFGDYIRKTFEHDGIDTSCLFTDPAGTDRSVNFVFNDGSRRNNYNGKNHTFSDDHVKQCEELLRKTRLVLPQWSQRLLAPAHISGCTILADIQDYHRSNHSQRQPYIEAADYLFYSSAEQEDPERTLKELSAASSCSIIVTGLGKKGCMVNSAQGISVFSSIDIGLPVLDTNGAGDSLALGIASSLCLEKLKIEDAVTRGLICAAKTCSLKASSDGMISHDELERLFSKLIS